MMHQNYDFINDTFNSDVERLNTIRNVTLANNKTITQYNLCLYEIEIGFK